MKKATIEINAKFGSKFQEQFARDCLLAILKAFKYQVNNSHARNKVEVEINGDSVNILDFFNWENGKL